MELHDIHTMHYNRDLTNAIPPTKVKEVANEKEQMQDENNSLSGFILFNNDSIKGFFMRPKEDTEFVFGPNGNTKFVSDSKTAVKEYDMSAAEIKSFAIGDRNFSKISFSPCAKGKTTANMHIMEELYQSDKIKLYKYYPLSGALGNEQYEFAYKKAGETEPVSLLDTRFLLWEKGLGNYFSDCEDLKAMCMGGGFKLQEVDLIKAARIYTEVCN